MSEQDLSAALERGAVPLQPLLADSPNPLSFVDPAVAALCQPISADEPCGPDLDAEGDTAYLNYCAAVEGVFPPSFFSAEDGKPFDRTTVDLIEQVDALEPLLRRTRDVRLLVTRARLLVLNRDLRGFAVSIAAIAELLDLYWDAVHPRIENGDLIARQSALAALELPTVVFPLQYSPLFETRRMGAISYRAWMIANGEAKPRDGEATLSAVNVVAARDDADPAILAAIRKDVGLLKTSIGRMSGAFARQGASAGLENLPSLVDKIVSFIDPRAAESAEAAMGGRGVDDGVEPTDAAATSTSFGSAGEAIADARDALAAIADYYAVSEPSSPTLPLVRQAHQLVGKSFFEVMSVLVPNQLDKVSFQIGGDQVFELPLGKLPKPAEIAVQPSSVAGGGPMSEGMPAVAQRRYRVESRPQAIRLLEQVELHFRRTEPSSPVPWLCQRARALAERDFMAVLRDVLPKAALKSIGSDK